MPILILSLQHNVTESHQYHDVFIYMHNTRFDILLLCHLERRKSGISYVSQFKRSQGVAAIHLFYLHLECRTRNMREHPDLIQYDKKLKVLQIQRIIFNVGENVERTITQRGCQPKCIIDMHKMQWS